MNNATSRKKVSILGFYLLFFLVLRMFAEPTADTGSAGAQMFSTQATGEGDTRNNAIFDAVKQAIMQASGVNVSAFESASTEISETKTGNGPAVSSSKENFDTSMLKLTRGRVEKYTVDSASQKPSGNWEAIVTAYFKPQAVSKDKLMAVLPLRFAQGKYLLDGASLRPEIIAQRLRQRIVGNIAQSRNFALLNDEFIEDFCRKKNYLESDNPSTGELVLMAQSLNVSYLLMATVETFTGETKTVVSDVSLRKNVFLSGNAVVSFSLLDANTRQIKTSDTVNVSIGTVVGDSLEDRFDAAITQIAKRIAAASLNAVYPEKAPKATGAENTPSNAPAGGDFSSIAGSYACTSDVRPSYLTINNDGSCVLNGKLHRASRVSDKHIQIDGDIYEIMRANGIVNLRLFSPSGIMIFVPSKDEVIANAMVAGAAISPPPAAGGAESVGDVQAEWELLKENFDRDYKAMRIKIYSDMNDKFQALKRRASLKSDDQTLALIEDINRLSSYIKTGKIDESWREHTLYIHISDDRPFEAPFFAALISRKKFDQTFDNLGTEFSDAIFKIFQERASDVRRMWEVLSSQYAKRCEVLSEAAKKSDNKDMLAKIKALYNRMTKPFAGNWIYLSDYQYYRSRGDKLTMGARIVMEEKKIYNRDAEINFSFYNNFPDAITFPGQMFNETGRKGVAICFLSDDRMSLCGNEYAEYPAKLGGTGDSGWYGKGDWNIDE